MEYLSHNWEIANTDRSLCLSTRSAWRSICMSTIINLVTVRMLDVMPVKFDWSFLSRRRELADSNEQRTTFAVVHLLANYSFWGWAGVSQVFFLIENDRVLNWTKGTPYKIPTVALSYFLALLILLISFSFVLASSTTFTSQYEEYCMFHSCKFFPPILACPIPHFSVDVYAVQ